MIYYTIYCGKAKNATHYGVLQMIEQINGAVLEKSDFIGLNECFSPVEREYKRGEIITTYSAENDTICIIKEGTVYLTTDNAENQRRIISFYESGDMTATCLVPKSDNRIFYLTAKTNCRVDFVRYSKFTACCEKHCDKHLKIISAFVESSHKKILAHTDILCQQTLRSKLLTFFEYIKKEKGKNTFTLPLPLSDLADYLSVDRSAMMREIKKMNEENIIISEKRKITVIEDLSE